MQNINRTVKHDTAEKCTSNVDQLCLHAYIYFNTFKVLSSQKMPESENVHLKSLYVYQFVIVFHKHSLSNFNGILTLYFFDSHYCTLKLNKLQSMGSKDHWLVESVIMFIE